MAWICLFTVASPGRVCSRASRRPESSRRTCLLAAVLLGVSSTAVTQVSASDPVAPSMSASSIAPTVPTTPASIPSASSGASPGSTAIPGFTTPDEGLPGAPFNPGEIPQMELIPNGMMPLQPIPYGPGQDLGQAVPLVPQTPASVDLKSLKYTVSKFNVKYGPVSRPPNPRLPPIKTLADTSVVLGEAQAALPPAPPAPLSPPPGKPPAPGSQESAGVKYGGLVGPGAGMRDVPVTLSQVKSPEAFSGDALQAIYVALVAQLNKKGIYGVFVVVDPDQINPSTGEDLRKGGTELTLLVYASEVRQVRTIVKPVAKFPFKAPSTSLDDPKYRKITTHSPLKAAAGKEKAGSLLERAKLQDYLDRINRFPGRRVDVAITASGEGAGVILDYIVHTERPPVYLFDQTSNTGTEASGSWRTRAGVEIRQLAGLDDILDASVETSLSSATYSFFGSYQIAPLFPDKLKLKAYGGYGRFFAEDVGFDQAQFIGRSGTAGLLAIYTPYYFKGFPLDLILGVEYKNVDIANVGTFPLEGKTNFLLPVAGVATDKTTDLYSFFGSLQVEANLPSVIGTDNDELQNMGRFNVSRDFTIAKYSFGGSVFLEPIIFRKKWAAYQEEADEAKRKGFWRTVTQAHELSFLLHGQYTFADKRLIPQFEDVIGGFASVRGYPEAYTSGDDSVILNAEYRFHLPRILKPADTNLDPSKPAPPPPRFALRPPTILGRPDFDLVFRAFYDFGYVKNNNLLESVEADRTLMSAGVGVEAQVLRYLNLRVDVGFPLVSVTDKTSRPTNVGDPRVSFIAVLSY